MKSCCDASFLVLQHRNNLESGSFFESTPGTAELKERFRHGEEKTGWSPAPEWSFPQLKPEGLPQLRGGLRNFDIMA